MLAFIGELAGKYELDGICLDYTRIGPFFSPEHLEPGRKLMTNMVARAREIVDRASQSRGRLIRLAALDYPDMDPSAWDKYITLRQEKGEIRVGELPRNFWLQAPYVATYEENYDRNCCL